MLKAPNWAEYITKVQIKKTYALVLSMMNAVTWVI